MSDGKKKLNGGFSRVYGMLCSSDDPPELSLIETSRLALVPLQQQVNGVKGILWARQLPVAKGNS